MGRNGQAGDLLLKVKIAEKPGFERKGMEKVSPYFVPMAIANMAAAQVAIRFGLKGMCTCPVTACAGGTNAVGDAFHRIREWMWTRTR